MNKAQKIASIVRELPGSPRTAETRSKGGSVIEGLKSVIKRNGDLYYRLIRILSPVFMHPASERKIRDLLAQYGEDRIILNIGSGPQNYWGRTDIINVDISPYKEVDILVSGDQLPVKENCADLVISIAALEHIREYRNTIDEIHRIAKPGGKTLIFVPFMQPYHAAPDDFQRWTLSGCQSLMLPFKTEVVWIGGGPTSGFLWVLQEWLALVFSFGSSKLSEILLLSFMVLTFPLKLLDLCLVYHPNANKIASGFYILAEKKQA